MFVDVREHGTHTIALQMLEILTEDFQEGALTQPAAVAVAPAGLPPEECAAAVDAGSAAVTDMRNFPPPEGEGSSLSPPPASVAERAAGTSQQQERQQQVRGYCRGPAFVLAPLVYAFWI